ncbi:hypothetical protein J3R83DRAFT_2789 [Lanmaoa asiatica]|nr:hypothetical protein J3R83DRAFT_2789 [Lanmaoa asiatica]
MADPTNEQRPNFASAAFRLIRETLMEAQRLEQVDVVARLNEAWDQDHERRVEEWNAMRRAEQQEEARLENERHEREEEAIRLAEEEAENEKREAEKKKPKIGDFNVGLAFPSVIVQRPSQYALQKIASFDFVELWYFSPEGCKDAAKHIRSSADDAFGLTNCNDILTLRPVASVKASQNARADNQLSFSEFLQARVSFLHHLKQAAWPEKHMNALAMFFWNLESHPQRLTTNGDLIVLTYAARTRRQWHDDLKADNGRACDISIINDALMNNIAWEVNDTMTKRRSVHSPSSSRTSVLTTPLPPLFPPSTAIAKPPPPPSTPPDAVAMPHRRTTLMQPLPHR